MDLSIIILSYNTKDITDECLKRLQVAVDRVQEKLGNKAQVIVLDNASSDGSQDYIKKNHPWVEFIESKENTGYSKGNNIALRKTKYPLILFLNSDVFLEEDTLIKALECFKNPDLDVLGPKLLYEDNSFQSSAGNLPNLVNIPFWILGLSLIPPIAQFTFPYHPNYKEYFEKMRNVGWVSGAFFMMKRKIYEKVGGFDEDLFMYCEEVEFCKRIKMAGYKIWYVPTIKVIHLHGASSKFDKSLAFKNELKGLKYYFGKYYPVYYPMVKIFLVLGLILRIIAFSLLGKTKRARAYLEGLSLV